VLQFRIFSTPVRIQWFFGLIALALGYSWATPATGGDLILRAAIGAAIVFTGVLAHEFGHAFAGRMFGLKPEIELQGFGGVTSWKSGRRLSPLQSIWVSFAGPLVGMVIGGISAVALVFIAAATGVDPFGSDQASLAVFVLRNLIWVNLGWGVLNLVPMLPLDGGNIMASFAELVAGNRGRVAARWLSLAFAVGLIAIAVVMQQLILGILVVWLAFMNWRALKAEREIGEDLPLVAELQSIQEAVDKGDPSAMERAERVAASAKVEVVRSHALQLGALAALRAHDVDRAERFLGRLPAGRPADPAVLGLVHVERGRFEDALPLLEDSYQRGVPFVEQPLAQAYAELGRFDRAAEVLASRARPASTEVLSALERAAYEAGAFEAAAFMGAREFERLGGAERAYNVACSYARGGHHDEALAWLEKAAKAGFRRLDVLDRDEDLAGLRDRAEWAALRARFG
jgi:Zn-dependent protease